MSESPAPTTESATPRAQMRLVVRSPRRLAYAVLGVACVGLAVAGVFIPGLPTTIFLIVGSWLLTKSCPYLEERLIRNRLFKPYLRYLDGTEPMPWRARVSAMSMMWAAVIASLALLAWRDELSWWFAALLVALACAGTAFIATWRRRT